MSMHIQQTHTLLRRSFRITASINNNSCNIDQILEVTQPYIKNASKKAELFKNYFSFRVKITYSIYSSANIFIPKFNSINSISC